MDDKTKSIIVNAFKNVGNYSNPKLSLHVALTTLSIGLSVFMLIQSNLQQNQIYEQVRSVRDIAVTTQAEQTRIKPVINAAKKVLGVTL